MTTSESVNEIATALAKAQGEMKNAPFNATNPHLKNKFANLASVRDTVVPALSKHGIAVVQTIVPFEGLRAAVATRLLHSSGQWMESLCPLPDAADMQKMGSAITYARRYSLSAICGIAADDDDDAEAVSQAPTITAAAARPVATSKAEPDGYTAYVAGLMVAVGKGTPALMTSFNAGALELRNHLTRANTATWETMKSTAAAVKTKPEAVPA